MKNVLVTGVNGFVGSHLVDELLTKDFNIHGTFFGAAAGAINKLNISLHELNICSKADVMRVVKQASPDYVYHLAAHSSARTSWLSPDLTWVTNTCGCLYLLEAVRNFVPDARVLLVGSSQQYGATALNIGSTNENVPQIPDNIYAISKVAQESLGKVYAKDKNIHTVMTRSFNHAGPRQSEEFVVAHFAKQIAMIERGKKEPVLSVGNLDARRDITDVRDVVRAYTLLLETGVRGDVYNVGSGCVYSMREILEKLLALSDAKIKIAYDIERMRQGDMPLLLCNNSKLIKATGWTPSFSIEQTLYDTLKYWRNKVEETGYE